MIYFQDISLNSNVIYKSVDLKAFKTSPTVLKLKEMPITQPRENTYCYNLQASAFY